MLFIPERHEALSGAAWSDDAARAGIERIVAATRAAFDPGSLWPSHPRDRVEEAGALPMASLYMGAAGVIWALQQLQRDGMADVRIDFAPTIAGLLDHSRRFNAAAGIASPSYFLGDAGVLLLQWKRLRDPATADALFALAEANLHNPTLEALWGSPGTLVAVLHMIDDLVEPSPQQPWINLLQHGAQILFDQMHAVRHSTQPNAEAWLWTQDLYGKQLDYLGAGHGFAGNVFPILRGARWLDPTLVARFEERSLQTLSIAALREGEGANWQPVFDPAVLGWPGKALMQDCHGAPGIVCRLASTRSDALREWLVRGVEAVWSAGPLVKPPGLCHGTDGNGYALLKLHSMTGETLWLERARAFAMHALQQSDREAEQHGERRFSLWTGDLGLALYLSSCLRADAAFPTLDAF
ncbi:MAG: LanC-like protein [Rhizobiales bacterium]|nr:LanC-like protein [Rhizobacter sp.]